jgi:hypothetical protein
MAQMNPFQNLEEFASVDAKMFGFCVLYLLSTKFFHSFPCPLMYHFSQEASKQMFTSLKHGIPKPPWDFGMQTRCQLARWTFLLSFVSFQRQLAI